MKPVILLIVMAVAFGLLVAGCIGGEQQKTKGEQSDLSPSAKQPTNESIKAALVNDSSLPTQNDIEDPVGNVSTPSGDVIPEEFTPPV